MKTIIVVSFIFILCEGYAQKIFDHIKNGEVQKVENWLKKNPDKAGISFPIENRNGDKDSLHIIEYAAYHNQKEILKLFIQEHKKFPDFNDYLSEGLSANIHNCDIETIKLLLSQGASVNSNCRMCRFSPPIAISLAYNCYDVFYLLLENGAKLVNENAGYDVIHSLATVDSLQFLKSLVEKEKLDVNQLDKINKVNSAFYAAEKYENLKYLIEKGADYKLRDAEGYSLFYYAGNLQVFRYLESLFEHEFDNSLISHPDYMLISMIIRKDDKELFDYFVQNYPKFIKPSNKKTDSSKVDNPLFALLETEKNTEYFFNVLMSNKLDLNATDIYGNDLKFYAKKMDKSALSEIIKRYEKTH